MRSVIDDYSLFQKFLVLKYFVYIAIERKEAILDPQGKAIEHALGSLGFREIENTRVGKLVRLTVEAASPEAAGKIAEQASEKLLANPIMETFSVLEILPFNSTNETPLLTKDRVIA